MGTCCICCCGSSLVTNAHVTLRHPEQQAGGEEEASDDPLSDLTVEQEKAPQFLLNTYKVMYCSKFGRNAFTETKFGVKTLQNFSTDYGFKMDAPESARRIPEFIQQYNIDASEFLMPVDEYKTFNEFFSRKLKPETRQIHDLDDESVVISPSDCRIVVYSTFPESAEVWVKGTAYRIEELLGSECPEDIINTFKNCAVAIARLAPQDCHRWHMPIDGLYSQRDAIDGTLYSVSTRAIHSSVDILTKNKREIYYIQSETFGLVLMISVGAAMVGSMVVTQDEGTQLKKGDEHGYFLHGGSTILLLFQHGVIDFDDDLLQNSQTPIETLVKFGERIGKCKDHVVVGGL